MPSLSRCGARRRRSGEQADVRVAILARAEPILKRVRERHESVMAGLPELPEKAEALTKARTELRKVLHDEIARR
jgi:hypothetical protein